jgi:ketosteroid isomerase-like protein
MHVTRRSLALAGAFALGAPILLRSSAAHAESGDQAAVSQAVEALRKALLDGDYKRLEQLISDQLSYGHSDGRVENRLEFIKGVVTRKVMIKSIAFPDLTIAVVGDAAVVRHIYTSESEMDGKPGPSVRIGALQVWQKQDGTWKLLARQGYKLA